MHNNVIPKYSFIPEYLGKIGVDVLMLVRLGSKINLVHSFYH